MYRTVTLAAVLAAALGIAGAAGPTDPQIAHIAYTAGLIASQEYGEWQA